MVIPHTSSKKVKTGTSCPLNFKMVTMSYNRISPSSHQINRKIQMANFYQHPCLDSHSVLSNLVPLPRFIPSQLDGIPKKYHVLLVSEKEKMTASVVTGPINLCMLRLLIDTSCRSHNIDRCSHWLRLLYERANGCC